MSRFGKGVCLDSPRPGDGAAETRRVVRGDAPRREELLEQTRIGSPRRARLAGRAVLVVLSALAALDCSDVTNSVADNPLLDKKDCAPGQMDKGKCQPVLPPAPVEPNLPHPAPSGGLLTPNRITVTPAGNFLVADPRTRSVVYVQAGSLRPAAALELGHRPAGVALFRNQILVGNPTSRTIDAFRSGDGSFQTSFGSVGLETPSDLAVDESAGLLFVSDSRSGRVFVFDSTRVLVRTISSKGTGQDQLFSPMGLTLDTAAGEVLVSDWGDFGNANQATAFVKVFKYDGTFVTSISGAGKCGMMGCTGGFSRPGSPILANGRIFVPDVILAQVLVFDRATGSLLRSLGGRPQLRLPVDLAVLNGNDLYVVSTRNGEIVVFPGGAQ